MLRASSPGILPSRCLGRVRVELVLPIKLCTPNPLLQHPLQTAKRTMQSQSLRVMDDRANRWAEVTAAKMLEVSFAQSSSAFHIEDMEETPALIPTSAVSPPIRKRTGFVLRRVMMKRAQDEKMAASAIKTSEGSGGDGELLEFAELGDPAFVKTECIVSPEISLPSNQDIRPKPRSPENAHIKVLSIDRKQPSQYLHVLRTSTSAEEAWRAYRALVSSHTIVGTDTDSAHQREPLIIHKSALNRLSRLLASSKPCTRKLYLRLLAVLSRLRKSGGVIHTWQWNALINCAGKGFRKTRIDDYNAAVAVYNDMLSCFTTGPSLPKRENVGEQGEPDIITYTTLLDIAARTGNPAAVRHALSLLHSSKLPPNRIAHLSTLSFFQKYGNLKGVHTVFSRMSVQGHDVGLDGINAFLWTYAQNGRFDVVFDIYRILYRRVKRGAEQSTSVQKAGALRHGFHTPETVAGLTIPKDVKPDHITYTIVIQALAYHGHLIDALTVWTHMLTVPNSITCTDNDGEDTERPMYEPSLPVFRALFCGFARHGRSHRDTTKSALRIQHGSHSSWTLENLEILIDAFINLPAHAKPSERIIYWVMTSFAKLSNNDVEAMRAVWIRLKQRFGGRWGGRLGRLDRKLSKEINITGT